MAWRSDLLQHLPAAVSMPVRARFGFSREPEMAALSRFISPGDNCLDIGCHLGIYAYAFLRLSTPAGRVVGFEPQPILADYVERSFAKAIRRGRFELRRTALGTEQGSARLTLPREGGKVNRGRASLTSLTGDIEEMDVALSVLDLCDLPRPVSFIKCDVEGFEHEVLTGGRELLAADMPTLLVEIEEQHARKKFAATFELLWDLGYSALVYRPDDQALGLVPEYTQDLAERASSWVGTYVYNYFFVAQAHLASLEVNCI